MSERLGRRECTKKVVRWGSKASWHSRSTHGNARVKEKVAARTGGLVKAHSEKKTKQALHEQCMENIGTKRTPHGLVWGETESYRTSYKQEQTGQH